MSAVFMPTYKLDNHFLNRLANGNQLTMLANHSSGDEESITTSTVLNNDPIGAPQRPLGIGRDTVTHAERLPDRPALHAHLVLLSGTVQREVPRGGAQRVQHPELHGNQHHGGDQRAGRRSPRSRRLRPPRRCSKAVCCRSGFAPIGKISFQQRCIPRRCWPLISPTHSAIFWTRCWRFITRIF